MNTEEFYKRLKDINNTYSLPQRANMKPEHYACVEYEKLAFYLQSNWNTLREWLERMKQKFIDIDDLDYVIYGIVLDKMNELEGGDNK